MPACRYAAHRVIHAAEIAYTAANSKTVTTAANPLNHYRVEESRLAYRRIVNSGVAAAESLMKSLNHAPG